MKEFSKDDLNLILAALKRLRDQSGTEGFKREKEIIDSFRTDDNKIIQLFYELLLEKIKDAIKAS